MKSAIKRLIGEEFSTIVVLNLLTALLCIPVITIGPALLAMTGTLIKILDDRCDHSRAKEFWRTFRAKLLPGIVYELVIAGYVLMLLWAQSLAQALDSTFLNLWTTVVGILAAMVFVAWGAILAGVKQPIGHSLWNSVLFAFGRLPKVLLSTAIVFGMLCIGYLLYPISVYPAMVILIGLTAALSLGCIWPEYQSDILNQCEG